MASIDLQMRCTSGRLIRDDDCVTRRRQLSRSLPHHEPDTMRLPFTVKNTQNMRQVKRGDIKSKLRAKLLREEARTGSQARCRTKNNTLLLLLLLLLMQPRFIMKR